MSITGDISVSTWVKTPSTWPGSESYSQIISRGDSGGTGWNLYLYRPDMAANRKFSFIVKIGTSSWGNEWALDTEVAQLDTWYHLVGVREGSNIKIYVNGELRHTDAGSSGLINYGSSPNNYIGKKTSSLAADHWNGKIDEVRIYDRALSASEISQLYRMGK